jgi:hypothetical protein
MSKTREILGVRWALGLSVREASQASAASTGVVSKAVNRATKAGLTWRWRSRLAQRSWSVCCTANLRRWPAIAQSRTLCGSIASFAGLA